MKTWLERLGYIAFGVVAGVMLRGIFEDERKKVALMPKAVAAVRG